MSNLELKVIGIGDFGQLTGGINNVKSAMQSLNVQAASLNKILSAKGLSLTSEQLFQLDEAFTSVIRSSGGFTTEVVKMSTAADNLGTRITKSRTIFSDYAQALKSVNDETNIYNKLGQRQAALNRSVLTNLGGGMVRVTAAHAVDMTNLTQKSEALHHALTAQTAALKQGATGIINWGKNTQWAGRQLTAGLVAPMIMLGATMSKVFLEVDKNLTRMEKVYGIGLKQATAGELAKVRDEVVKLSKELGHSLGVSAAEVTDTAAQFAAAGLTTENGLIEATRQASRIVILGETDKQEAIKATIALQTAYRLDTNQLTEAVNFFNAAQAATSTNMNDLVEAVPRVGPVVRGLGGTYKDMVAIITALKEGGVPAGEAANAVKTSLGRLINPTEKAKKTLMGFGIDIEGIVNKNAGNLTGTIISLQTQLDKLSSLERQKAIAELFGKFQFARMTALMDNFGKTGTQSAKIMEMMGLSAKNLSDIADKQTKKIQQSLSGRFKIAMEDLKNAILPIGKAATEMFLSLLKILKGITNWLDTLPSGVKSFLKIVAAGTSFISVGIMVLGLFGNLVGNLLKGLVSLRKIFMGGLIPKEGLGGIKGWFKSLFQQFEQLTAEQIAAQNSTELFSEKQLQMADAVEVVNNALKNQELYLKNLKNTMVGVQSTPSIMNQNLGDLERIMQTFAYTAGGDIERSQHHNLPYRTAGGVQGFADYYAMKELSRVLPPGKDINYTGLDFVPSTHGSSFKNKFSYIGATKVEPAAMGIQGKMSKTLQDWTYFTPEERKEKEALISRSRELEIETQREIAAQNARRRADNQRELNAQERQQVREKTHERMYSQLLMNTQEYVDYQSRQMAYAQIITSKDPQIAAAKDRLIKIDEDIAKLESDAALPTEQGVEARKKIRLLMDEQAEIIKNNISYSSDAVQFQKKYNSIINANLSEEQKRARIQKLLTAATSKNMSIQAAALARALANGEITEKQFLRMASTISIGTRNQQLLGTLTEDEIYLRNKLEALLIQQNVGETNREKILSRLTNAEKERADSVKEWTDKNGVQYYRIYDAQGKLVKSLKKLDEVTVENAEAEKKSLLQRTRDKISGAQMKNKVRGGVAAVGAISTIAAPFIPNEAAQTVVTGLSIGADIGAMLPGYWSLLGPAIGLLGGAFKALADEAAKTAAGLRSVMGASKAEFEALGVPVKELSTTMDFGGVKSELDKTATAIQEFRKAIQDATTDSEMKQFVEKLKDAGAKSQIKVTEMLSNKAGALALGGANKEQILVALRGYVDEAGLSTMVSKIPNIVNQALSYTSGEKVAKAYANAFKENAYFSSLGGMQSKILTQNEYLAQNPSGDYTAYQDIMRSQLIDLSKSLSVPLESFMMNTSTKDFITAFKEIEVSFKNGTAGAQALSMSITEMISNNPDLKRFNKLLEDAGVKGASKLLYLKAAVMGLNITLTDLANMKKPDLENLITNAGYADAMRKAESTLQSAMSEKSTTTSYNPKSATSKAIDSAVAAQQKVVDKLNEELNVRNKIVETQDRQLQYEMDRAGLQQKYNEALASGDMATAMDIQRQMALNEKKNNDEKRRAAKEDLIAKEQKKLDNLQKKKDAADKKTQQSAQNTSITIENQSTKAIQSISDLLVKNGKITSKDISRIASEFSSKFGVPMKDAKKNINDLVTSLKGDEGFMFGINAARSMDPLNETLDRTAIMQTYNTLLLQNKEGKAPNELLAQAYTSVTGITAQAVKGSKTLIERKIGKLIGRAGVDIGKWETIPGISTTMPVAGEEPVGTTPVGSRTIPIPPGGTAKFGGGIPNGSVAVFNKVGANAGKWQYLKVGEWKKNKNNYVRLSEYIGGVQKYASGGYVFGPGGPTSDMIPAMLSSGEYVMKASAVDRYGKTFLDMLNAQKFNIGGMVGAKYAEGGAVANSSYNSIMNVNVNVAGTNASPQEIANAVSSAIQRRDNMIGSRVVVI